MSKHMYSVSRMILNTFLYSFHSVCVFILPRALGGVDNLEKAAQQLHSLPLWVLLPGGRPGRC